MARISVVTTVLLLASPMGCAFGTAAGAGNHCSLTGDLLYATSPDLDGNGRSDGHYEIAVRHVDGTTELLTNDGLPNINHHPVYDAQCTEIAWDRNGSIWLMAADGNNPRRLPSPSSAEHVGHPWIGGDGLVYFAAYESGVHTIWRMRKDGSGQQRVSSTDADRIHANLHRNRDVLVYDYKKGRGPMVVKTWSLSAGVERDLYAPGWPVSAPIWHPDGKSVVLAEDENGDGLFSIAQVAYPSGTRIRVLVDDAASNTIPYYAYPAGTTINWVRQAGGGDHDTFTMRADGTGAAAATGAPLEDHEIVGYVLEPSASDPSQLVCEPRPATCTPRPPPCPFGPSVPPPAGEEPEPHVELIFPGEGGTVAGQGAFVRGTFFAEDDALPVVEWSFDGTEFAEAIVAPGPDFGLGSFTAHVDVSDVPPGPLHLRARLGERVSEAVAVTVNRLPAPKCTAKARGRKLSVDCSGSADEDGEIVRYAWDFGEQEPFETTEPKASFQYSTSGIYRPTVHVYDSVGMFATWSIPLKVDGGRLLMAAAAPAPFCGCKKMTLKKAGPSSLKDQRRHNAATGGYDSAPLGPDPSFPTTNFEIEVELTQGSDPALCAEGQDVKSTITLVNPAATKTENKQACTKGKTLPVCNEDKDCDTHKCVGGAMDGRSCDGGTILANGQPGTNRTACLVQGGTCRVDVAGKCTAFPKAGAVRGNDDYRAHYPGDQGAKFAVPGTSNARWLDTPGAEHGVLGALFDVTYTSDFVAFMKGSAGQPSCQCHFEVVVDWLLDADPATPGNQSGHRPGGGSQVKLLNDAETSNCQ